MGKDNPGPGYEKLTVELRKVGFKVSKTPVRTVLERYGVSPALERNRQDSWRVFLNHYKDQFLARDLFTVERPRGHYVYLLNTHC